MQGLNEIALDWYLRGNGGELARREAQGEVYRRGQQSSKLSEQEMVDTLRELGYVVFKPRKSGR